MSRQPTREPTKRDLAIWKAVRIEKQRRIDVAIEFGLSLLMVGRTVAFVDRLQGSEPKAIVDVQSELAELLRLCKRGFRLSQVDETLKVKRDDEPTGNQTGQTVSMLSNIGQTSKIRTVERVRRKTAGDVGFLRLAFDITKTLQPTGLSEPTKQGKAPADTTRALNAAALRKLAELDPSLKGSLLRITSRETVAELVSPPNEPVQDIGHVIDVAAREVSGELGPSTGEPQ